MAAPRERTNFRRPAQPTVFQAMKLKPPRKSKTPKEEKVLVSVGAGKSGASLIPLSISPEYADSETCQKRNQLRNPDFQALQVSLEEEIPTSLGDSADAARSVPPGVLGAPAVAELKRHIRLQVEYYFSDENLLKDDFFHKKLRANNGCIPMRDLLNCNRLISLRASKELILAALEDSHLRCAPDGSAVGRPLNAPLPCLLAKEVAQVHGRVLHMARESKDSSRKLQAIIGSASDAEGKVLVQELKNNVVEVAKCYNANFVLQQFIAKLTPQAWQFIIAEIEPHASELARHRVGCRVVQRLIEHCNQKQLQSMLQLILQDAKGLCMHPYGNFVAQCLLEHPQHEQQLFLAEVVRSHAMLFCSRDHALAVVSKAFCLGTDADREAIARAVLGHQNLLLEMACSRHGSDAMQSLLTMDSDESDKCRGLLLEKLGALKRCRYGRMTAKLLPQDMQQGMHPTSNL